jgi:hypothetical protein
MGGEAMRCQPSGRSISYNMGTSMYVSTEYGTRYDRKQMGILLSSAPFVDKPYLRCLQPSQPAAKKQNAINSSIGGRAKDWIRE